MPNFKYEAQDAFGDAVSGVVTASDAVDARRQLHGLGLLAQVVHQTSDSPQAPRKTAKGKEGQTPFTIDPTSAAAVASAAAATARLALPLGSAAAASAASAADIVTQQGRGGVGPPPASAVGGGTPGADDSKSVLYLLEQIRDAILALSGGYSRATGQASGGGGGHKRSTADEFLVHTGSAADYAELASRGSAGESQSGANLTGFIRGIQGMLLRRSKGYAGKRAGTETGALGIHFGESGEFGGDVGLGGEDGEGKKPGLFKRIRTGVKGLLTTPKLGQAGASRGGGGSGGGASVTPGGAATTPSGAAAKSTAADAVEGTGVVGALKLVGTGAMKAGAALLEAGKMTYAFARSQEKEIRRLAEVGGTQAAAIATLDVGRLKRDIKTASETGDTSSGLTQSINEFEEALRPIETLATNVGNALAGGLLDILTSIVGVLGDVAEGVSEILSFFGLWRTDDLKKELKKLPAQQIERIIKEQEKIDRPHWPAGPVGSPSTVGPPGHGGY